MAFMIYHIHAIGKDDNDNNGANAKRQQPGFEDT
jgi:hypothetical protein